ncbi:5-formyltetrahydrofolate cyclo-ligase [Tumebacillus sp. ITR2]|uniref:5-formyltetrahydrofolate cyclo-ligase n=1 Tax=Tumebacillus amylolyticus TaxID=2801339 RepID=A0ABS1JFZ9_9BACL|nr:5-formyltetrahydrofolate cyclo-ligase [Tumebacillus amylolyticus]MBL0389204.1 5-formyltetrahydrofolate cyclo-ligase [Tumebacillus amylolyticus]
MNPLEKKALRRQLLDARLALSAEVRANYDNQILAHLITLPQVQGAQTILLYLDFRSEVSSHGLIEWAVAQGKTVCAPVTVVAERRLIPVRLRSAEDVILGAYDIREPANQADVVDLETIDLVVLPGVGFDRSGGRLGYGGGYYDRFLPRLKHQVPKIAVAYELQVLPEVPLEPHDTKLDVLVTEAGIWEA